MAQSDKVRFIRAQNKKKRRLERKRKLLAKKPVIIVEQCKTASSFNKAAWNNTPVSAKRPNVLKEKHVGFNKQAWNNG
jgi:hypothetical protein